MDNWELETAAIAGMPGRISGRRCGRKFFHRGGIPGIVAELETAAIAGMPGRISGRRCGRKFFHRGGILGIAAELE